MKASLKEDDDFERAHQEKDVIKLRKLLKTINFNYKKSEEPIKTLWQANKDYINLQQNKIDVTKYFERLKSLDKVAKELQQSESDHCIIDIICRERFIDITTLDSDAKAKLLAEGEEQMMAMQLSDRDQFGSLIEDYDREYLSGYNKYPKTLQDAYNLLKGWNKRKSTQRYPKVGLSFNTMGNDDDEDGVALANDESKPPCPIYNRTNHTLEQCVARRHMDGTMLLNLDDTVEVDENEEESEVSTDNFAFGPVPIIDFYCGDELEEPMCGWYGCIWGMEAWAHHWSEPLHPHHHHYPWC